jgi:catechol 2,3-dioxygenase-like lactoylglutathione lyase family enzyme
MLWHLDHLVITTKRMGIAIEEGPVQRTGAQWPIRSVYVRDPDLNLIELSEPL